MIHVDLQIIDATYPLPSKTDFEKWIQAACKERIDQEAEICLRIVSADEIAELNQTYRHQEEPTNVLSFNYDMADDSDEIPLLGDIVLCAGVVIKEAVEQKKEPAAHWAHMTIHGTLHLLGYDHLTETEAERMESEEIKILKMLGFDDPYSSFCGFY